MQLCLPFSDFFGHIFYSAESHTLFLLTELLEVNLLTSFPVSELKELAGKEQEKVAEVARVRVELQEQIGHLQAERTAQGGLKEKIAALEREMKGTSFIKHKTKNYANCI